MKEKISVSMEKNLIERIDSVIDGEAVRNRSQALEYLVRNYFIGKVDQAIILCAKHIEKITGKVERSKFQFKLWMLLILLIIIILIYRWLKT